MIVFDHEKNWCKSWTNEVKKIEIDHMKKKKIKVDIHSDFGIVRFLK